jgi:opacity protein-like surface antigen
MKRMLIAVTALALAAACAAEAQVVGQTAPDFTLGDANGNSVSLSDFRGKTVVLEWHNPDCPFVRKHYGSGNMQRTQAAAAQEGVVWLTINSSGSGKQGHVKGSEATAWLAQARARPTAYLLDPRGTVGRAYRAQTTPHMYIVDGAGTLVYAGAIDDKPTPNPADIPRARNHVLAALGELKAGRPVSVPTTRPYGCSVKYR